jgi:hypothetical protein
MKDKTPMPEGDREDKMIGNEIQMGLGWLWKTLHEQGEFRLEMYDGMTDEPIFDRAVYRIVQITPLFLPNVIRASSGTLHEIRSDWKKLLGTDCPYNEA